MVVWKEFLDERHTEDDTFGLFSFYGFGLPAAIAAQLIYPDRQVVCVAGDGGFSMLMADFVTAIKYELPVKIFILNNRELGMIRQEQLMEGYENWQTELYNFDFAEYARICGVLESMLKSLNN